MTGANRFPTKQTTGPCKKCPADFDENGNVGVSDLLALLANWGPCP